MALSRSGHFLPVPLGQRPVAGHHLLHQLPLVVVADREAVAGPQFTTLELVLLQEFLHGLADLPDLFALAFDLVPEVEDGAVRLDHDRLDFAEQGVQPLPLLRQGGVQGREAGVLTLADPFELGEGQSLVKLRVRLDLAAEEIPDGDDEERHPLRRPCG